MACKKQYSGLVAMALILFAVGIPLAYGQMIPMLPDFNLFSRSLSDITVNGILLCTGNCSAPGPTPIPGKLVNLNCTNLAGASVVVGQGTTTANGSFSIFVPGLLSLFGPVFNYSVQCTVSTPQLPININQAIIVTRAPSILISFTSRTDQISTATYMALLYSAGFTNIDEFKALYNSVFN